LRLDNKSNNSTLYNYETNRRTEEKTPSQKFWEIQEMGKKQVELR
jgi:hypothetical protein